MNTIINGKPQTYALLYIANIFLFSFIYWYFFNWCFNTDIPLSYLKMLYFSIVTVTTLGYGDIIPNLNSDSLLITIMLQVSSGIMLIGLFLNSLSQKLSDLKDEKIQNEQKVKDKLLLSKQMVLLKPIIEEHLKILSKIYRATSSKSGKNYHIKPTELFNITYYDQICMLDYYSEVTISKDGEAIKISWAEYLKEKNSKFVNSLDNYLMKFSTALPIEIIETLSNMQTSFYLNYPNEALLEKKDYASLGINIGLTLEHSNSSLELPENEKVVKIYHELLLKLIKIIDESLSDKKISIFIRLDPQYPNLGSATINAK